MVVRTRSSEPSHAAGGTIIAGRARLEAALKDMQASEEEGLDDMDMMEIEALVDDLVNETDERYLRRRPRGKGR